MIYPNNWHMTLDLYSWYNICSSLLTDGFQLWWISSRPKARRAILPLAMIWPQMNWYLLHVEHFAFNDWWLSPDVVKIWRNPWQGFLTYFHDLVHDNWPQLSPKPLPMIATNILETRRSAPSVSRLVAPSVVFPSVSMQITLANYTCWGRKSKQFKFINIFCTAST